MEFVSQIDVQNDKLNYPNIVEITIQQEYYIFRLKNDRWEQSLSLCIRQMCPTKIPITALILTVCLSWKQWEGVLAHNIYIYIYLDMYLHFHLYLYLHLYFTFISMFANTSLSPIFIPYFNHNNFLYIYHVHQERLRMRTRLLVWPSKSAILSW